MDNNAPGKRNSFESGQFWGWLVGIVFVLGIVIWAVSTNMRRNDIAIRDANRVPPEVQPAPDVKPVPNPLP